MPANPTLEEIEKRAEAATAGPWRRVEEYADEPRDFVIEECPTKDRSRGAYCVVAQTMINDRDGASPQERSDADFIAHARTDVPFLLAEVRRTREALRLIALNSDCGYSEGTAKNALTPQEGA